MDLAFYDTYATDIRGGLLHLDVLVPVGTSEAAVVDWVRRYVGSPNPEIEVARRPVGLIKNRALAMRVDAEVRKQGYFIQPAMLRASRAA